jgi:hypothetical protein
MKAVTQIFIAVPLLNVPQHVASFAPSLVSRPSSGMTRTSASPKRPLHPRSMSSIAEDVVVTAAANVLSQEEEEQPGDFQNVKSYLDDGFIFGLEGSGLDRPKGKTANVVVEGDSLETTPMQVAIVAGTLGAHSLFALNSIAELGASNGGDVTLTAVQSLMILWSSYVIADFGSGVFHWSVDNYGNGRTPIMGTIIAAFQGHHSAPWTITERGFFNNVYKLCTPFGIPTMVAIYFLAGPATVLFFANFCALEILSQEFHKWGHMTKKQVPAFANVLQDLGVTVGRKQHAQHHIAPYDGNYCIVSGACNNVLDKSGFFRWMELQVYNTNGVESNAWKLDADLRERTLNGDFRLPERKR